MTTVLWGQKCTNWVSGERCPREAEGSWAGAAVCERCANSNAAIDLMYPHGRRFARFKPFVWQSEIRSHNTYAVIEVVT